jgi:cytochrome c-type biogenesis protein CcmH/NrfF
VALQNIPRVPLWQIIGMITLVMFVGSIATVYGAGRPPSSAFELILTFVPPVGVGIWTLALWVRARRRAKEAAAAPEAARPSDPARPDAE